MLSAASQGIIQVEEMRQLLISCMVKYSTQLIKNLSNTGEKMLYNLLWF